MKNETRAIKRIKFIEKSNLIHQNKFDYSNVDYINCDVKVKIICPQHGIFLQTPYEHLKGHKCAKCVGVGKLTTQEFIDSAKQKHLCKYSYLKTNYISSKSKVIIICKYHGEFLQSPNRHLQGDGCPKCSNIISKPESEWLDYLKIASEYRQPKHFKINGLKIKPDAYDPLTNTIYEFYGDFYHGNPKKFDQTKDNPLTKKKYGDLYSNTMKKEQMIISAGYNLVTIWESDWKNLKDKFVEK
jgi:hypothetical protein